jgi:beta-lactamase superfamily II metal-dependent hydrolase
MDDVIEIQPDGPLPVSATVLHPMLSDQNEKADDRGLVLMMQLGRLRALWLGDAGFITEKKLIDRHLDPACDILIRGQHSADISGLTELLIAAHPKVVISSSDSRFPEQTLPQRVRDFCALRQIHLFDLEVCGSVNVEVTQNGVAVTAFRNGQEAVISPSAP